MNKMQGKKSSSQINLRDLLSRFKVLKKCRNKFDCLINEMLYIKQLRPCLNVQLDSIRAKVFV